MHEHVDYAIELGSQAIPIAESKVVPQIYFFEVVQKSNTIVHLLEKLYAASVIPCVEYVSIIVFSVFYSSNIYYINHVFIYPGQHQNTPNVLPKSVTCWSKLKQN